jgi:uncharacterized protein
MTKFLLFVAVVGVIWFLVRATRRRPAPPPDHSSAGAMVSCARCGVHFPAAESFRLEGLDYCSEEHRRLGAGS